MNYVPMSDSTYMTGYVAIEPLSLGLGSPDHYLKKEYFHFLFITEGKVEVSGQTETIVLRKGEFVFLSRMENWMILPVYRTTAFVFSFGDFPDFSGKHYFRSLSTYAMEKEYILSPYKINSGLEGFLLLLYRYQQDGIPLHILAEEKLKELFLILKEYYSVTSLVSLLHPLVCRFANFSRIILDNWQRVKSTRELMLLCHMSRSSFERKFRKEFGCSVLQWLLKQKAELVQQSLSNPDLTMEEIRKKYGFNSATHFSRFCQSQFGCTPTDIRKHPFSNKLRTKN